MMKKYAIITFMFMVCVTISYAQNHGPFRGDTFPIEIIPEEVVRKRNLQEQMHMLVNECDWKNRIGKKIDVFWLKTENGNLFGHVYEYFMDCDNLRLIYWQADPSGLSITLDFMIEPLEEESQFVVAKKKHLKNKKKYRPYLEKD